MSFVDSLKKGLFGSEDDYDDQYMDDGPQMVNNNSGLGIIGQREKLLRKCLTAPGPESLSTASGHDQSGCFHIISSPLIEILCRVKTE